MQFISTLAFVHPSGANICDTDFASFLPLTVQYVLLQIQSLLVRARMKMRVASSLYLARENMQAN